MCDHNSQQRHFTKARYGAFYLALPGATRVLRANSHLAKILIQFHLNLPELFLYQRVYLFQDPSAFHHLSEIDPGGDGRVEWEVFEQWACNVLDKCSSREDAMLVLMRPSEQPTARPLIEECDPPAGNQKSVIGGKNLAKGCRCSVAQWSMQQNL